MAEILEKVGDLVRNFAFGARALRGAAGEDAPQSISKNGRGYRSRRDLEAATIRARKILAGPAFQKKIEPLYKPNASSKRSVSLSKATK